MAWNPSPRVVAARDAARKLDADGVVVVYLNTKKGTLGMASYGATRRLCRELGSMGDKLFETARDWWADNAVDGKGG